MGSLIVEVWMHGIHAGIYINTNVKMLNYYTILTTYIHGSEKNSCCEIRVWWVWLDFIFASSSVPDLGGKARVGIIVDFVSILKLVPLSAGLWMGRPWEWCFICQNTDFISIKEFFVFYWVFLFYQMGLSSHQQCGVQMFFFFFLLGDKIEYVVSLWTLMCC